jgi:hypothetical protein
MGAFWSKYLILLRYLFNIMGIIGDAVGVLLIGVPISSLSGSDKEGLIAASKGKIIAMETRLRSC